MTTGGLTSAMFLNDDESDLIVNLASNEYFKAIDQSTLNANILRYCF